ncbi:MAG: hypothetical protein AAGH64_01895 [Planctomycetota bacterium]
MFKSTNARIRLVLYALLASALPHAAHAADPAPATLLARTGDASPAAMGGGPIDRIGPPAVSISDAVALGIFTSASQASPVQRSAIVRRLHGRDGFEAVAWSDLAAPPPAGVFVTFAYTLLAGTNEPATLGFVSVNALGDTAFYSGVSGATPFAPGNDSIELQATIARVGGTLRRFWQQLEPLPQVDGVFAVNGGTVPIMRDDRSVLARVTVNDRSNIALLEDPNGAYTASDRFAGFRARPETMSVNRRGDAAAIRDRRALIRTPLVGPTETVFDGEFEFEGQTVTVSLANDVSLADDGTLAFFARGRVLGSSLAPEGIWIEGDGGIGLFVERDDEAPGSEGGVFRVFRRTVAASRGFVFFEAWLGSPDGDLLPPGGRSGLWFVDDKREVRPLVRDGGIAPGTDGALFDDVSSDFFQEFSSPSFAVNTRGDAVIPATLRADTSGVEQGVNDAGLWAYDSLSGALVMLVRTGDAVDVAYEGETPDVRTVASILFEPSQGLADNGRVGYTLEFTDGSFAAFSTRIGEPLTACAADLDTDGDVDMGDFGRFAAAFSSNVGDEAYDLGVDLDFDGDVDLGDFGLFGAQFGRSDCDD